MFTCSFTSRGVIQTRLTWFPGKLGSRKFVTQFFGSESPHQFIHSVSSSWYFDIQMSRVTRIFTINNVIWCTRINLLDNDVTKFHPGWHFKQRKRINLLKRINCSFYLIFDEEFQRKFYCNWLPLLIFVKMLVLTIKKDNFLQIYSSFVIM